MSTTITAKYDIDDTVYIKTSYGVKKGQICAIGIDMSKIQKRSDSAFAVVYLIWVSDRKDNAGHHERHHEHNLGRTFEEAYYEANNAFSWNIMDDVSRKDFKNFFKDKDPVTCGEKD